MSIDPSNPNIIILVLGLIFITAEIAIGASSGFDLLIAGVIFIISSLIGYIFNSINVAIGMIFVISLLYIFVARKFIRHKLTIETKATNIDSVIGRRGVVVSQIAPHQPGQIRIDDEIWRAKSNKEHKVGEEVVVDSVSGVTLLVH